MTNRLKHHWLRIKSEATPRWQHFPTFCEDIGELPYNHRIARPDTLQPYGPHNFQFIALNNWAKKPARTLRYKNHTQTINEWAQTTGLSSNLIRNRLRAGWTITQTLETKVKNKP